MNKLKLSVGVLAFIGLAALNFTQSESCFVNMALAEGGPVSSGSKPKPKSSISSSLISSSSSFSSDGGGVTHSPVSGSCPVWRISVQIGSNGSGRLCTIGGIYRCVNGPCPHEK